MMSVDENLVADQLAKKRKPIIFDLDADVDKGAADVMQTKKKTSPSVAFVDDDVVELPSLDFDKSLSAVIEAKKSGSESVETSGQQMSKRPNRRKVRGKINQTAKVGKVNVTGAFNPRATNEKLNTVNRKIKERKVEQNKIQTKITMSRAKRDKQPGRISNYQDRKQANRSPVWKTAFGGFQNEQIGGDLCSPGQNSSFNSGGTVGFGSSILGPQPNFAGNQRPLQPPPPRVRLPPPGVAYPTMVMPSKPVPDVRPRDQFAFAPTPKPPPPPPPSVYQKAPFDGRGTSSYPNFKPPLSQRGNFDSFQGPNFDPRFDDCNDEPYSSERRSVDPRYRGGEEMANPPSSVGRQMMDDFARIRTGPEPFDAEMARGVDLSRVLSMPPKEMLRYVQKCSQDYADELDRRYPDVRKVMGRLVKTMIPDGCGGMKAGNVVPCDVYNQDNSCNCTDVVHFDENGARRIHSCAVCYFSLGGMINLHRQGFCPLLSIVK